MGRLTWGRWANRVALDEVGRSLSFSTEGDDGRHAGADGPRSAKHLQQEKDLNQ